jgi:hypothetical protein
MTDVLLDECGEAIRDDLALRQAIETGTLQSSFQDYAVQTLHYVRARMSGRSLHVALQPDNVSTLQASALLRHVSPLAFDLLVLSTCTDGAWQHELVAGHERALTRIRDIRTGPSSPRSSGGVTSYAIGDLVNHHPFAELASFWKPQLTMREIGHLIERTAIYSNERFSLIERCGAKADFILREHGHGYPRYAVGYMQSWLGRNILEHPDEHYGRQCAHAFERVSKNRSVAIELVDATIFWPMAGRIRRTYTRALLPFGDPGGRSWVLSTSITGSGFSS